MAANALLRLMPAASLDVLLPRLEEVPLVLGQTLYEEGAKQSWVYFPVSGIVSLVYVLASGQTAELGVTGRDGLIGVACITQTVRSMHRAVVQVSGSAFRVDARSLVDLQERDPAVRALMLRYVQVMLAQLAQTSVCNRHHSVTQQFCRWILLSLDRLESNQVSMTQQLVAAMLGVRREGISLVASQLKEEGLIDYTRGLITVLNRRGVEKRVCECYAAIVQETSRLIPADSPSGRLKSL